MKKQMLICILIFSAGWLIAGTMQESFLKANAAYNAGKVQDALTLYKSIEPKGQAVWHNMGNCYFKLGNYADAIVQWRRAQKYASWREVAILEQYIIQAYRAQGASYDQSWQTRMHALIIRGGALCSLFMLQLIFLCLVWILFLCGPGWFKKSRYALFVLLSVSTLLIGVVGIVNYRVQEYPYGLVTKNVISVYAGPGRDFALLAEAKMLDTMRVYQKRDGWLKVRLDRSGYGWIAEADLEVL